LKKTIRIKNIVVGEGPPKICVPIVGRTIAEIIDEATFHQSINADLIEWRADFYEQVENIEKVQIALRKIRTILHDSPLIFTFRSTKEGGEKEISSEYYFALNKTIIDSGLADVIDLEFFNDEKNIKALIERAHTNNVFVILSNHDFQRTPSKEEIITRLQKAQELGADLPKIAVMPLSAADVLTLLDATLTMNEHFADRPIITMSMAGKGVISRLAGEVFGSCITFGSAKQASAPGQISFHNLKDIINLLHENL